MRPDRVLIVTHGHPALNPGGAEIAAYAAFQDLQQRPGIRAFFLAWTGANGQHHGGTPFSAFQGRADEILFYTDSFDHFLFSQQSDIVDQFAMLLRRIAPDVIHLHHYSKIGLEFIALARSINPTVRIVVTLHEYLAICHNYGQMIKVGTNALCNEASPQYCSACFPETPSTEFLLRQTFIRAHFEKVDCFIAPSEFLRQRYIAWGLPSWQIVTLGNGTPVINPPPPRRLRPGEGRGAFAFFGQINPFKGLLPLLAAFEYVAHAPAEETAGVHLTIHGANLEFQTADFIELFSQSLGRAATRVRFAGPYAHRDMSRLMAAVDWVVVPSIWWENAPLVIQEALAHRRPVICSDIGGMAEMVRPGVDGFHFPVGNPFELAGLVLRLARDPAIWDRLQTTMARPLSTAEAVSRLLDIYRDQSFAMAG
jgi:glycosyltransferase involved in cell wall biosynthesis